MMIEFPNYVGQIWFCFAGLCLTFCKQEFSDPRDADDARYHLDGKEFDGSRIIVEFAKGVSIKFISLFG